jgi:predicted phage terminase large subunit-like protein
MLKMNEFANTELATTANAARRQNFYIFLLYAFSVIHPGRVLSEEPYLETLCFELQETVSEAGGRLIITMPPRYLKSVAASIALPAWVLGRDSSSKVLVASYANALATDQARLFRRLVGSSYYKAVFPGTRVSPVVDNTKQLATSSGGGRRAVTVGGSVTGIGGDLVIVDDIMKASDANSDAHREAARRFFDETLYTRLNDKRTGSIIVVQQRLHQDDLIAHLIDKQTFRHINLPAIAEKPEQYRQYGGFTWEREKGELLAPSREGYDTLQKIKTDIGVASFTTQYQQDPASAGSAMLDFSKVTVLEKGVPELRSLRTVQAWDTAIKDGPNCDYSVGMTFSWIDECWVLLDVVRRRMNFGDLKVAARCFHEKWAPDLVVVEDSANGSALVSDLRKTGLLAFNTMGVKGSKEERFAIAIEWLEAGEIVLLRSAPYFEELRRELLTFPEGRFDDQVDTISLFVRRAKLRRPMGKNEKRVRRR